MNKVLPKGQIWVWSETGESRAKTLGLELRKAGTPAYCGRDLLGRCAPLCWVEKNYVIPAAIEKNIIEEILVQFEVSKTYYARSIGDHECIFTIKVIERTEKMLTYEENGERLRRSKIRKDAEGEYIQPDRYSGAPLYRASREFNNRLEKTN